MGWSGSGACWLGPTTTSVTQPRTATTFLHFTSTASDLDSSALPSTTRSITRLRSRRTGTSWSGLMVPLRAAVLRHGQLALASLRHVLYSQSIWCPTHRAYYRSSRLILVALRPLCTVSF